MNNLFSEKFETIINTLNTFVNENKDLLIDNKAVISGSFALYLQFYEPRKDDNFDIDIIVDSLDDFVDSNLIHEYKTTTNGNICSFNYYVNGITINISEKNSNDIQTYTCSELLLPIAEASHIKQAYEKSLANENLCPIDKIRLNNQLFNAKFNTFHLQCKIQKILYEVIYSYSFKHNDYLTRALITNSVECKIRDFIENEDFIFSDYYVTCDESNNPVSIIQDNDVVVEFKFKRYSRYFYNRASATTKEDNINIRNLPSCFKL